MSERTPPVTMKVVAERVGVSIATVSNAFSRPDQLSAQLRADILTAADALGYAGPNATGRALRSGRTDVCGILYEGELANTFLDPYSVLFLAGLSESVEAAGASVLLMKWLPDDESRGALRRAAIDALVAPSVTAAEPTSNRCGDAGCAWSAPSRRRSATGWASTTSSPDGWSARTWPPSATATWR